MAEELKPAKAPKLVTVTLLSDIWDDSGERIRTNVPVLDENGRARFDPKTGAPVVTKTIVDLPAKLAKKLVDSGAAKVEIVIEE